MLDKFLIKNVSSLKFVNPETLIPWLLVFTGGTSFKRVDNLEEFSSYTPVDFGSLREDQITEIKLALIEREAKTGHFL